MWHKTSFALVTTNEVHTCGGHGNVQTDLHIQLIYGEARKQTLPSIP